jgi:hypothetical protein
VAEAAALAVSAARLEPPQLTLLKAFRRRNLFVVHVPELARTRPFPQALPG